VVQPVNKMQLNLIDGPIKKVVHYVLLQYYRYDVYLMILAHDFFPVLVTFHLAEYFPLILKGPTSSSMAYDN